MIFKRNQKQWELIKNSLEIKGDFKSFAQIIILRF